MLKNGNKPIIVTCIIIVLSMSILIAGKNILDHHKCYVVIKDIAANYRIDDIKISFQNGSYGDDINIDADDFENLTGDEKYIFIKELDDNTGRLSSITNSIISIGTISSNNNEYSCYSDGIIYKNGEEYYDVNREEKERKMEEFIKYLSENPPYVGMSETYINNTSWGKPTSRKKCLDYDKLVYERRSSTYYWGTGKMAKQVYVVGGEVLSVTTYDKNGIMITDDISQKMRREANSIGN